MEDARLARLLARLESGANQTAAGFATGMTLVAGLFALFAVISAADHEWGLSAGILVVVGFLVWLGRKAATRNAPDKMLPVVGTLRDKPEQVTSIRRYETSDSMRLFTTKWLEIRTTTHRLLIKATDDSDQLLALLTERCPQATLLDR